MTERPTQAKTADGSRQVYAAYDVGSEFIHPVCLDDTGKMLASPRSVMHFGNPGRALRKTHTELSDQFGELSVGITGSNGKSIAESLGLPYFFDTVTIPLGAHSLDPKARYVFHLGSLDSYFFEKYDEEVGGQNRVYVVDYSTGTKCGGGSGLLISKQCRRFFEEEVDKDLSPQTRNEEMLRKAVAAALCAEKPIDVGGRCGVVIQSDMIHLQNSGERMANILGGMFDRVSKNYRSDVIRIRQLDQNAYAIATGGVCSNDLMVQLLARNTGVRVVNHEYSPKVAAIGCGLKLISGSVRKKLNPADLDRTIELQRNQISYAPALREGLKLVHELSEDPIEKLEDVLVFWRDKSQVTPVVLGVDGGSTTTKAVVAKLGTLEAIGEVCVETHGKPIDAARRIFGQIDRAYGTSIDIKAVAYTGSSGGLYYKLFTDHKMHSGIEVADLVKDEITCHARGVKHYNGNVDTIFELGGQDAKFTVFNNGSVRRAKMNLSCMAGTGQTMQNMIKMIGMDFREFERMALAADRTPIVDDSCGVFTEAGISKLVALGLPREEIAAAIAYGFIGGYVHKFVGNEKLGNCISAQGGPFRSKACLAALALHTGAKINSFPHRQLFGAYGAAISAYKHLVGEHD